MNDNKKKTKWTNECVIVIIETEYMIIKLNYN